MPYATGDRVRLRRVDTRTRARNGDFASVVSTDTTWDDRHMVRVRLERDFARTQLQARNGYDYSLTETQVEPAPAAAESSDSLRPFAVGDRVRLRNGTRTLESIYVTEPEGTEGTITDVYGGGSYGVRTDIRRSGWSVSEDMMELIPAASAPAFTVGQRVRLRNAPGHTLSSHYITEPAGTEGVIRSLDEGWETIDDGEHILVRTDRDQWYVYRDQIEPVPAEAVQENANDRHPEVEVGDRIVCLRANGVPEATGLQGEVIRVRSAWNSIQVRFDETVAGETTWNVHEWSRVEPTPTWTVGMRVRRSTTTHYRNDTDDYDYGDRESHLGDLGEVTQVNESYLSVTWDNGNTSAISYRNVEPYSAPAGWVAATADNVRVGSRIRYIATGTSGSVEVNDEGVVAQIDNPAIRGGIRILMDNPRPTAYLSGSGDTRYHWRVSLDDIEVQTGATTPTPVENWRRLNSLDNSNSAVGRRIRYSTPDITTGQLRTGDTGRVVFSRPGGAYCVLMDDPRGKSTSTYATGGIAYHWTTTGSDFEVDMGETPAAAAAPAQTYEVTYGNRITTWTVGETLMWGNREVRVIPLGSVESARGGGWVEVHVVAENRDTGISPDALTRPAAVTPSPAETPRDANGEVTFTDEQKRAIARIAQRYGESHGFERMAREIVTALGADPNQGNRRRTRLTFSVDVELEGRDYTLPASADDLRSMIRTSQANALVDAVLNRRVRRLGDATLVDRGITYRD